MKFLKLDILNLASLDRPDGETIDFEQGALGDSTIFSIVGPMGSGKSTLLDAICLALYGNAPRYPFQKGDRNKGIKIYGEPDKSENSRLVPTDPRNILTRGKKEGYSKLTFLANNGTVYRAEWHVRLREIRFDPAKTYLFKLVAKNGKTEEEEANWNDLPSIIGLDYGQFLRTVLIAQGSFASFIKADENERFALLEKLIGCEKLYSEISTRILQKKKEVNETLTKLETAYSVHDQELIPPEELQSVVDRIAELEAEDQKTKTELGQISRALGWYDQEKQYTSNLKSYLDALTDARKNQELFQEKADRLALHDATLDAVGCYKEILTVTDNIQKQDAELEDLKKQIGTLEITLEVDRAKLGELEGVKKKAQEAFEELSPHINRARTIKGELEAIQRGLEEKKKTEKDAKTALYNADDAVKRNADEIEKAYKALNDAKVQYESLKSAIEENKNKIGADENTAKSAYEDEVKKAEGKDAQALQDASNLALEKKNDIRNAIEWYSDIKTKTKDFQDHQEEIKRLRTRNGEIDKKLAELKPEELQKELELHRKTLTLMTSDNWDEHRHLLEDGKPCPLCGSIHHPFQADEAFVPVLNELDELIVQKDRRLKEAINISEEKGRNEAKITAKGTPVQNLENELARLREKWSTIHSVYPEWPEDVIGLKTRQRLIEDEARKAGQDLKDYNDLVKRINDLRIKKEDAENASRQFKEESDTKLAQAKQLITDADTTLQTERGKTENLKQQALDKSEYFRKAEDERKKGERAVNVKLDEINSEIGDHDPDLVETQLKEALKKAVEDMEKQKGRITEIINKQNGLKGREQTIRENQKEENRKQEEKQRELDMWVIDYNAVPEHKKKIAKEDIRAIYGMTEDWEKIRREWDALKTTMTRANTTYENEKLAHITHQKDRPESTEEQLNARKKELEKKDGDELINLKARKKRHDSAQEALGDLTSQKQEAERLKQEWEEIADSIGGDGKTLRKIAQCYTLRFLIEHANDEIRKFNSRYELVQVKNSLGIRVIDHDRADDIRDTTSLSGGETFIVSLGLALGLSSLSSRNISFGNLFIDEGFGTLDPDTLTTVLDSLAMLQSSQGKKVGIISHTDTMSERITTQIRIIKEGNSGSSHIELYP